MMEFEMSARVDVIAEIKRLLQVYESELENLSITFTGHSLGDALATLSAYDTKRILGANHFIDIPVTVFSFASPRVGSLAFAKKNGRDWAQSIEVCEQVGRGSRSARSFHEREDGMC
ncbi:hypothetical protein SUGI_0894680 [Cryptomeria japonica]|nr:hypothetical protein SUGI_0894680 [Cryptomeria japonica]